MKCLHNKLSTGDLVYWYSTLPDSSGIGIVIAFRSKWTEILIDGNLDLLLSSSSNIEKIENYKSLEDFKSHKYCMYKDNSIKD